MLFRYHRVTSIRMVDYTPNDTVIYLHVPKCGGTTIHGILRSNFSEGSSYYIDPSDVAGSRCELVSKPEEERRRIQLLHGHLSYGWHKHLPGPATYFTFIRHPVERVISHYNYVRFRKDHEHYLRDTVERKDMSIGEYVSSGVCDEMNNGQVRLLAGVEDIVQMPYGDSTLPYGTNETYLLKQAIQNIERHFAFVGLQERFDESLLLMKDRLRLATITYQRKNTGGYHYDKQKPTEEEREIIEAYNQLDLKLYEAMEQRWSSEFDRLTLSPLRLGWHHVWNRTCSAIGKVQNSVAQVKRILVK